MAIFISKYVYASISLSLSLSLPLLLPLPLLTEVLNKLRVVYLLAYNGIMWSGFILIVLTLLRLPAKGMGMHKKISEASLLMLSFI